jgi:hypothetical protein
MPSVKSELAAKGVATIPIERGRHAALFARRSPKWTGR